MSTINWKSAYKKEHRKVLLLESLVSSLQKIILQKDDLLLQKDKKIQELTKRDNYHDNSNTPPSKDSITRKQDRKIRAENKKSTGKKQGGQPGRTGVARKVKVDEEKEHKLDTCTKCGSQDIHHTDTKIRIITDIVKTPPPHTCKHKIHGYHCNCCGATDITPEVDIPKKGQFGNEVIKEIMDNHIHRMPVRMNKEAMKRRGIEISEGGIQNIIDTVSDALFVPANEIKEKIQEAEILIADETSERLHGKTIWLWTFHNPITSENFYIINPSRGADVLKEIIGDSQDIIITCDGWPPYRRYIIQRCNAHLIREIKTISQKNPDSKIAKNTLQCLQKIYHDGKHVLDKPPDYRESYAVQLEKRTRNLVKRYANDEIVGKFVAKLSRAIPDMFRFVIDPRIPSTSNLAEQSLREYVVCRRIRGCLRSEKSMERRGNLYTCVTTWKNLGQDYLAELVRYI